LCGEINNCNVSPSEPVREKERIRLFTGVFNDLSANGENEVCRQIEIHRMPALL